MPSGGKKLISYLDSQKHTKTHTNTSTRRMQLKERRGLGSGRHKPVRQRLIVKVVTALTNLTNSSSSEAELWLLVNEVNSIGSNVSFTVTQMSWNF